MLTNTSMLREMSSTNIVYTSGATINKRVDVQINSAPNPVFSGEDETLRILYKPVTLTISKPYPNDLEICVAVGSQYKETSILHAGQTSVCVWYPKTGGVFCTPRFAEKCGIHSEELLLSLRNERCGVSEHNVIVDVRDKQPGSAASCFLYAAAMKDSGIYVGEHSTVAAMSEKTFTKLCKAMCGITSANIRISATTFMPKSSEPLVLNQESRADNTISIILQTGDGACGDTSEDDAVYSEDDALMPTANPRNRGYVHSLTSAFSSVFSQNGHARRPYGKLPV